MGLRREEVDRPPTSRPSAEGLLGQDPSFGAPTWWRLREEPRSDVEAAGGGHWSACQNPRTRTGAWETASRESFLEHVFLWTVSQGGINFCCMEPLGFGDPSLTAGVALRMALQEDTFE